MSQAILKTNKGDMLIEFYDNDAPNTVANFKKLALSGFYNGLKFHRVIKNFMIQGGCPLGDGTGGPGYTIMCETSGNNQFHDRGVLSMAKTPAPNSGGSQFFICYNREHTQHLDRVHTCFGKIIDNIGIIDEIQQGDIILSIEIKK
jgi:peptidyl-prolyl cis-trans isomerase B (cyclophilin B)